MGLKLNGRRGLDADKALAELNASVFLDPAAPAAVVREGIEQAGRLDILVNNAGLMREGTVLEMKEAGFVTGQIRTVDGGRMAQLRLP